MEKCKCCNLKNTQLLPCYQIALSSVKEGLIEIVNIYIFQKYSHTSIRLDVS